MSARRRGPLWPKIAVGVIAIALLAAAVVFMSRLFLGALNLLHTDGGPVQRDPQFAEPAETALPPAELQEGAWPEAQDSDPSSLWVEENQTPVDKTAAELARENEDLP